MVLKSFPAHTTHRDTSRIERWLVTANQWKENENQCETSRRHCAWVETDGWCEHAACIYFTRLSQLQLTYLIRERLWIMLKVTSK
jgi:hypothetical protein